MKMQNTWYERVKHAEEEDLRRIDEMFIAKYGCEFFEEMKQSVREFVEFIQSSRH